MDAFCRKRQGPNRGLLWAAPDVITPRWTGVTFFGKGFYTPVTLANKGLQPEHSSQRSCPFLVTHTYWLLLLGKESLIPG